MNLFSPPRSDSLWSGRMFFRRCLYFLFQPWDLRDALADRCEILHGDKYWPRLCNAGPKFQGRTPKIFQGPKTCKIWPNFGWLQNLVANISGTDAANIKGP